MKVLEQTYNWLSISKTKCITVEDKLKEIQLIKKLVIEELDELETAVLSNNKSEEYNAIADSYVVLSNLPYMLDLNLDEINNELDKTYLSNCTKYCKTLEEAEQTQQAYLNGTHPNKLGIKLETFIRQKDGVYYLVNKDEKIMKSINYLEPNQV